MIRYTLAFILLFSLTIKSNAQSNTKESVLQAVVINLFDAISVLDVEKARTYCTSDIMLLENGEVWNFDTLALRLTTVKNRATSFKRVNKLDFIETKMAGDIGWVTYFNEASIQMNGNNRKVKWLESVVLKKESNEWRISLLHSTVMKEQQ